MCYGTTDSFIILLSQPNTYFLSVMIFHFYFRMRTKEKFMSKYWKSLSKHFLFTLPTIKMSTLKFIHEKTFIDFFCVLSFCPQMTQHANED